MKQCGFQFEKTNWNKNNLDFNLLKQIEMKTIMISIYQNKLKWKQFGFQFVRTNWNHQTTDQIWCCFFHIAAITLHSDQTHHQGFLASHVPWHAHVNYSPTASFGGSAPKAAAVYASYEHLLLSSRLWVLQLFETIPPLEKGGSKAFPGK